MIGPSNTDRVKPNQMSHLPEPGKRKQESNNPAVFQKLLEVKADTAKDITKATGMYISTATHPHAIVEDPGFRN